MIKNRRTHRNNECLNRKSKDEFEGMSTLSSDFSRRLPTHFFYFSGFPFNVSSAVSKLRSIVKNHFSMYLFIRVTYIYATAVLETFRLVNFVDFLRRHFGKAKSSNSLHPSLQIHLDALSYTSRCSLLRGVNIGV